MSELQIEYYKSDIVNSVHILFLLNTIMLLVCLEFS